MFKERREEVNEFRGRVNGQRDAVTLAGQKKVCGEQWPRVYSETEKGGCVFLQLCSVVMFSPAMGRVRDNQD